MKIKDKEHLRSVIKSLMTDHGPNVDLNHLDVSAVTDMVDLFFGSSFNGAIDQWDVSNVTDMSHMFNNNPFFNQPIEKWSVSNVRRMKGMFNSATSFNQPIGNWNVCNVSNMKNMFCFTSAFNQPIGNWNVSNVTDMADMFRGNTAFSHFSSLLRWNVSNDCRAENFYMGKDFKVLRQEIERGAILEEFLPSALQLKGSRKAL
jgi:surface protein